MTQRGNEKACRAVGNRNCAKTARWPSIEGIPYSPLVRQGIVMSYFSSIPKIAFEGPGSDNPLAFRHYDAGRVVLGKTMAEHLRLATCYWHTFVWPGSDVFGAGTFERPWQQSGEPMAKAREKADAA